MVLGLRDMEEEVVKGRKRRLRKEGIVVAMIRMTIEMKSVRDVIEIGSVINFW